MVTFVLAHVWAALSIRRTLVAGDEGFSTAELLGNAALGIAALVAIWGVLQILGVDVVNMIRGQIMAGG